MKKMQKSNLQKIVVSLLLLTFFSFPIFSQVSIDPNDEFYALAQGWELKGLTDSALPLLRPYPLTVIKKILNAVIVNGGDYVFL